jgi:hypothetical protein
MEQEEDDYIEKSFSKTKINKGYFEHKPKRFGKGEAKENRDSAAHNQNKFSVLEKKFIKKVDLVHDDDDKKTKIVQSKPIIIVDREVEVICDILKYMLGEYKN